MWQSPSFSIRRIYKLFVSVPMNYTVVEKLLRLNFEIQLAIKISEDTEGRFGVTFAPSVK